MESIDYFNSDDMIEWEDKDEVDKTFDVVHTFFKKKYDSYVKYLKKKHGQFEGANFIQHVTQRQEQLDTELPDYLDQLASTTGEKINDMRTPNQATVKLNETLPQTIVAQNKKIDKLFQMVAAQATDPPTTNNQKFVPPPEQH